MAQCSSIPSTPKMLAQVLKKATCVKQAGRSSVYESSNIFIKFRPFLHAQAEHVNGEILHYLNVATARYDLFSISDEIQQILPRYEQDFIKEDWGIVVGQRVPGKDPTDLTTKKRADCAFNARHNLLVACTIVGIWDMKPTNVKYHKNKIIPFDLDMSMITIKNDIDVISHFNHFLEKQTEFWSIFSMPTTSKNVIDKQPYKHYAQQCDDILGILKTKPLPKNLQKFDATLQDCLIDRAETLQDYLHKKQTRLV